MGSVFNAILHAHLLEFWGIWVILVTMSMLIKKKPEIQFKQPSGEGLVSQTRSRHSSGEQVLGTINKMNKTTVQYSSSSPQSFASLNTILPVTQEKKQHVYSLTMKLKMMQWKITNSCRMLREWKGKCVDGPTDR